MPSQGGDPEKPPAPDALLVEIPTKRNRRQIYRLASIARDDDFLDGLGLDTRSQEELKTLLEASGHVDSTEEILDAPFRRKPRLGMITRYSDGTYPVFYSSLDLKTAEAEVAHWFMQSFGGRPDRRRAAYYQRFACTFDGLEKDLRGRRGDWPELVDVADYAFCNRIGSEAVQLGLDGLVAPSARREEGSNVPVFRRQAISNPESHGTVTVAFDPHQGEVTTASAAPR